MQSFNFLLNLNSRQDPEELVDQLFEAGCDDATLHQRDGYLFMEFDREAISLAAAIQSALDDIAKVHLTAKAVEPSDVVNLSEMAERTGKSREYLRSLLAGERKNSPPPAPIAGSNSKNRLWRWSEVSAWLEANTQLIDRDQVITAWQIREANEVLSLNEPAPAYVMPSSLGHFHQQPISETQITARKRPQKPSRLKTS
jgi:hypothetical protein